MSQAFNRTVSRAIVANRSALCEAIVTRHYALRPELAARYGAHGRAKCLEDTARHLDYLSQAIAVARPALFADYVAWAKVLLTQLGIPVHDLTDTLTCLQAALADILPAAMAACAAECITIALRDLPQLPVEVSSFITDANPLAGITRTYLDALLRADRRTAERLVLDAVGRGVAVKDLYIQLFQCSQYEIGRLWQMNEVSVAQEHYCTAATQLIMAQLYPHVFGTERCGRTLVAACVAGELHEIGARMVADFFEMDGWDTFYLGANTPASGIVETLVERQAHVLGLSGTMAFHVSEMAAVIEGVRAEPACLGVRILVGGHPFNRVSDLWRQVGADASARDAQAAVRVANQLVADGAEG